MSADESVVSVSEVRRLEDRVRELERLLGRKTKEAEIVKEALERSRAKNRPFSVPHRSRALLDGALRRHLSLGRFRCGRESQDSRM